MAKPHNRPFRRLRALEREWARARADASAAPTARVPGPPSATGPADEEQAAPTSFSEVAARAGIERASARPLRVAPLMEPAPLRPPSRPEREHAFTVRVDAEHVEGRRDDTEEVVLPWLERQEPRARLDCHGMDAELARRATHRFVRARARKGHLVVLVVTGRGRHSREGAVLRESLPDWLTERAVASCVLAFTSAPPEHGGRGAVLVLLEPRR